MNITELQAKLGVAPDGVAGRATFTALFRKLGASQERAGELGDAAAEHFGPYGIMDNPLRFAHFLAQLVHESGSFRYMEEIASGAAYEGRRDLGNTQPGDGRRFKGRGPIQITGRANYRTYGHRIGIDLESCPQRAAEPKIGLRLALEFWKAKGLNALADRDDVEAITRRINGGVNGLADRKRHLAKMKAWLA